VSGALGLDAVDRIAGAVQLGGTGYAQVAAADGIVLVHPRREWVAQRRDFSKLPIWAAMTADAGRVASYIGSLGDERVAGYATVPGVGWKIWVNQAIDDLESEVWSAYARILALGLATLVVGTLAAVLAFAVVTPIRRLQVRASAIACGNLAQQVPERGPAEIAALARAFNVMSDALERRESDLRASERGTVSFSSGASSASIAYGLTAPCRSGRPPEGRAARP
jgi:methyl-accepting chemotaxis protein